jgi:hypothetical protein
VGRWAWCVHRSWSGKVELGSMTFKRKCYNHKWVSNGGRALRVSGAGRAMVLRWLLLSGGVSNYDPVRLELWLIVKQAPIT